jgi:hypothetical protein
MIHPHALGYEGKAPYNGTEQKQQVGSDVLLDYHGSHETGLLVSKSVLAATVRALPGDPVAGHAPHIFIHARLTDHEAAAAAPAKRGGFGTAVADLGRFLPSAGSAAGAGAVVRHRLLLVRSSLVV